MQENRLYKDFNDSYILVGDNIDDYSFIGIDLNELYDGNKAYMIEVLEEPLLINWEYIEQDENVLFDDNINKYFKCLLLKKEEILERAKLYNLFDKYKYMIDQALKQYDCL